MPSHTYLPLATKSIPPSTHKHSTLHLCVLWRFRVFDDVPFDSRVCIVVFVLEWNIVSLPYTCANMRWVSLTWVWNAEPLSTPFSLSFAFGNMYSRVQNMYSSRRISCGDLKSTELGWLNRIWLVCWSFALSLPLPNDIATWRLFLERVRHCSCKSSYI